MPISEKIREWIDLALVITGAVPGVTGGIVTFIRQFMPEAATQEWTEEKVRAYVTAFRQRQDARLEEFDKRRTDNVPPGPEPEGELVRMATSEAGEVHILEDEVGHTINTACSCSPTLKDGVQVHQKLNG